jgi:single-strand DNA-binding protein
VAPLFKVIRKKSGVRSEQRQITTFVDVQVWGPSAQNFANLVRKGQEISIEGSLRQDRWEDKQTGQNSM